MAKVINVTVSEEEFLALSKKAEAYGLSIPRYIISRVLPENIFENLYEKLSIYVNNLPSGTKFNLREIFGVEWKTIPKGMRLALGRVFYKNVEADKDKEIGEKKFAVELAGLDDTRIQCYIKM